MTTILILLVFSLAAPLPLLVIEHFLPYPFVIEELLKVILIYILINQEKKLKKNLFLYVIISGLFFSISESIFYLINIFAIQNYFIFFQRLLFTSILHICTLIIIYIFFKCNKYWWIFGFSLAIFIHFLYNYLI